MWFPEKKKFGILIQISMESVPHDGTDDKSTLDADTFAAPTLSSFPT